MNYFVLENGKSSVFGNIERNAINELYCMFFYIVSFILRSAVGVTNLLLTKNLVSDLQQSLSKHILSFTERFSKGSVTFPMRILIHFLLLRDFGT